MILNDILNGIATERYIIMYHEFNKKILIYLAIFCHDKKLNEYFKITRFLYNQFF